MLFAKRTKYDKLSSEQSWGHRYSCKGDIFTDSYMGKIYKDGEAFEMTTTHLSSMVNSSSLTRLDAYATDPELWDLAYSAFWKGEFEQS